MGFVNQLCYLGGATLNVSINIWDIFNTYVHVGVGYYLGDDYYLIDSRWTTARTQLDVTWMSRVFRIAK